MDQGKYPGLESASKSSMMSNKSGARGVWAAPKANYNPRKSML